MEVAYHGGLKRLRRAASRGRRSERNQVDAADARERLGNGFFEG